MPNEVTKLIQLHRSIRKYKDTPVSDTVIQDILDTAQRAPSYHNIQAYSIIIIKNKRTKRTLRQYCNNQKYVEECPVFLVFCMDYYKLKITCDINDRKIALDELDNLIVGISDVSLVAQNALIAAESYGLGVCMIGEIKRHPEKVAELLKLPPLTFPLMGMCLGYPDEDPLIKPRLPKEIVIHEEFYQESRILEGLEEYEDISREYYIKRSNGKERSGWGEQISKYMSEVKNAHLKEFILNQGFSLK